MLIGALLFIYSPYTVNFIMPDGEEISVKAVEGDTMLDLAQRYDIDLECKYFFNI